MSMPHPTIRRSRFGSALVGLVLLLSGLAAVTLPETAVAADPCAAVTSR